MSKNQEGSIPCWSESYLTGRTQLVKMEDYLSEFVYCHSGVPQGSYLGPFFVIDTPKKIY
jgi:hypothetical protein